MEARATHSSDTVYGLKRPDSPQYQRLLPHISRNRQLVALRKLELKCGNYGALPVRASDCID
jgi:hypothetical protein